MLIYGLQSEDKDQIPWNALLQPNYQTPFNHDIHLFFYKLLRPAFDSIKQIIGSITREQNQKICTYYFSVKDNTQNVFKE